MNPCESSNLSFSAQTLGKPKFSEGILFFGDGGKVERNGAEWTAINTAINTMKSRKKGRWEPPLFFIRQFLDGIGCGDHIGRIRVRVPVQHFGG